MYKDMFAKSEDSSKQNSNELQDYQSVSEKTYHFVIENFSEMALIWSRQDFFWKVLLKQFESKNVTLVS